MLGKGLLKIDDYIRFGEIIDKLSEYCYTIQYVPNKDLLIVCTHKNNTNKIKETFPQAELVTRGGLAFAKIKWRD